MSNKFNTPGPVADFHQSEAAKRKSAIKPLQTWSLVISVLLNCLFVVIVGVNGFVREDSTSCQFSSVVRWCWWYLRSRRMFIRLS